MSDIVERLDAYVLVANDMHPGNLLTETKLMSDAKDEIERLRALTTWQPIETAPKDGTNVLVYIPAAKLRNVQISSYLVPTDGWAVYGWKNTNGNFIDPSLWQPMPEPPQESAEGTKE